MIKNLSGTRWCADASAVKALRKNYSAILVTLSSLTTNDDENPSTKSEASVLLKKLQKFENILNIVVWDTLLQRFNKTSIDLQKTSFNLNKVTKLYKSLIEFTQNVRDNFDVYEKLAKDMCTDEQDYEVSRKKVPPRSKDLHASSPSSSEIQMTPRETYKINVYFAICDH